MLILEAANIKKYYGDRLIIGFDELKVYSGDKIGIIGQNGSGKTTLLNILANEIEPDEGFVREYCGISYIRQFSNEMIEAGQKILKEFNLSQKADQKIFSGGEETRIKIANALSRENILLFADEPTSNLDYQGIELFKQKLCQVNSFLLISHDRFILDSFCNKIIEVKEGRISFYSGNYSFYKEQRDMEHERSKQEYENYLTEKANLAEAISDRKDKSKSMRKAPKRMGNSEARLHKGKVKEKKKKIDDAAKSLKTRLKKLEVKEKPKELSKIKLDFSLTNPPENRIVVLGEKITFSYGNNRIFNDTGFQVFNGSKTALWGENGSGKTTLLNLISSRPGNGIYIVPKGKIGFFRQGFENLELDKTVMQNVMKDSIQTETIARTMLARLLISGENVHKMANVLSGGERIKVSFAKLFVSNANILLLDEPTNYLDMLSIEALENVLCDYEGTVLFVSHDRSFVNAVADRLLVIENQKIIEFEGDLQDFEMSKQAVKTLAEKETDKIALQMRIAEVVSKLSYSNSDKKALEEEYQSLITQLHQLV